MATYVQLDENGNPVNVILLPDEFSGAEWDGLAVKPIAEMGEGWTFTPPAGKEES